MPSVTPPARVTGYVGGCTPENNRTLDTLRVVKLSIGAAFHPRRAHDVRLVQDLAWAVMHKDLHRVVGDGAGPSRRSGPAPPLHARARMYFGAERSSSRSPPGPSIAPITGDPPAPDDRSAHKTDQPPIQLDPCALTMPFARQAAGPPWAG